MKREIPGTRLLTAADIAEVIGIERGSLQDWLNRGLLRSTPIPYGARTLRLFNEDDVYFAALVGFFYRSGYPPAQAKQMAEAVEPHLSRGELVGSPEPGFIMLWREGEKVGKRLLYRKEIGAAVEEASAKHHAAIVFKLDDLTDLAEDALMRASVAQRKKGTVK